MSVVVLAAALVLAGCSGAPEKVLQREVSPDGRYEAVLMVCQQASDFTSSELVVAVFEERGRGCDKAHVHAVTDAVLTHPAGSETGVAIRWEGEGVVMNSDIPLHLTSGTRQLEHGPKITFTGQVKDAEAFERM